MEFSLRSIIQLLLYFTVATSTVATWTVSAWDGLACGDLPQASQQFLWDEKEDIDVSEGCERLDPGTKAYSMSTTSDTSDIEVWAFAFPGCKGGRKKIREECTNPDISVPYFTSYKVIFT